MATLVATVALLQLACATLPGRHAGTGDISFRLLWTGPADLDLHVRSPRDEDVWFAARQVESGGVLDVDCNAMPETMCEEPVENVVWPSGGAPGGAYRYWVQLTNRHGAIGPVPFRVLVLLGERVVRERSGSLDQLRSTSITWTHSYAPR
ncbi:MAG: hypothetical protein QF634_03480 [Vicinamibacterales bacterium]|nr:hypothetical protein [Vicinamibacterales bacterium]